MLGKTFNNWTVVGDWVSRSKNGHRLYPCVCICGTRRDVIGGGLCVMEWAARVQIHHSTIRGRLNAGWSVSNALTQAVQQSRGRV